ncbi:germ cell-less protein-like 2 [Thomomys bottae]
MGSLSSRVLGRPEPREPSSEEPEPEAGPSSAVDGRGRKRKQSGEGYWDPNDDSSDPQYRPDNLQFARHVSHKKKAKISSTFAYQNLFLNGMISDIKIRALGNIWYLHKVFLSQSGYFAQLFRDSWDDSSNDIVELEIHDQNINVQSLHLVLGSLYREEDFSIEPSQVPSILATAHLLQVEDVIYQCNDIMKETINVKTVCAYYTAADAYGLDFVKRECFEWLLHNLMTHPMIELYKEISLDLMNLLITSSNLLVMQKEVDIYTTLKQWMFLHLNPDWKGSINQLLVIANNWLSNHMQCASGATFLETRQGKPFQPVFKKLRFHHIICDLASTGVIEKDHIIPSEWLSSVYKQQWLTLLKAQKHKEIGPRVINVKEFEGCSMRCGKKVIKDGKYSWKWSGFHFGFPLHVIFASHCITFKQNTSSQMNERSTRTPVLRHIAFRLTLVNFDSNGNLSFRKTTGYKIISFENDEEQIVMRLDNTVLTFPLYVFCNFLFISSENTRN